MTTTNEHFHQPATQVFDVQGMTCGHCERAVTQAVQSADPEATVRIDRSTGRVEVGNTSTPRAAIAAAIAEEGYAVAP
jgi:copper chaperone